MARFGKLPVNIPEGVKIETLDGVIKVTGSKGETERKLPKKVTVKIDRNILYIESKGKDKQTLSLQGTIRSHIINMITGVTIGWKKTLELVGSGYRAEVRGKDLVLTVGFSHPVKITAPEKIGFSLSKNIINVEGIDLETVSETAAKIRHVRKPEPYKGKGIKYIDEVIRRKAGKAAAKTVGTQ
ncbi:50S ribosomal protein L6 [Candidatus Woesebacteria bacterium RIFCSPLOWO2_01_FULL_39_21]|uniref:50S ribosomal protein L6 n=1 Tax=Candidatus Woesebacteria bacterium RIFCSPLOWO2_01_FULL_39_21 TaxID=1802519 RepID=A0A1F8BDB6_9BACT|nr:MAG: 50S ribosomal protein L6 [Candidatus Woesebacteria bacterium RIFCSPHIGHO2_01_FULL_39_23]OGM62032.1 MAG: 50S ribosomal protein L6 [Candidatus Woesebacteria bacterium RIFCSPLOWO2_01_FULL_39_21]